LYSLPLPLRFAYQTPQTEKNGKIMNSQTSTKQTTAWPKVAQSAENNSALKRLLKLKTYKMTFKQISRHFVSGSLEKVAWAVHALRE